METTWAVATHGNPLGSLTRLVEYIWMKAGLDGLFVSSDTLDELDAGQHLLDQPDQLERFNPFRPAMRTNAARFVPGLLREKQTGRYGAVLRPCEIRTLKQLGRLEPFPEERLVTICVDCLGTFPAADIAWRAERQGSADNLAQDTLKFARQGGISMDRYRHACQVCRSPGAEGADVNIWVIGLPARQHILVNFGQEALAEKIIAADIDLSEVPDELPGMRGRVLSRVMARNYESRERLVEDLVEFLPTNIDVITEHLENCWECRKCLDACPICAALDFKRGPDGRFDRLEVAQWLASCAGCGMCEQACVKNIPLSAIFAVVHEQVRARSQ